MRVPILAAAAAITLGACQPAADPQPVEAQTAPGASATTPMEAAPVATPEPTPQPQAAAPAPAPSPRASTPRPTRPAPAPAPAPTPPPADPMAGHDMSKMDGMTMPPNQ
ncbi:hypothetical protein KOAAANKH_00530 [Brevundimonas sp. NIBR10]|jgi:hypothetical protein|uniref:Uncharacterized protein n=2 Tax=Brevundimonas mediterranea TaxID=74329 RepID=A0A7W6A6G7_9CAUL|nr:MULTISPECIES: hypothetical protein [Brevundimonas]MBB3873126.1 hypothetical protein [Brevundimonas mediterranea]OGN66262.1 MAG: hypothetical protein A3K57_08430 [Caulobacterales bacterium RIFOXYA1_FULL_67_7]WGM45666.1 hypothetical protein KOAAANKH_00530 [Brevundimonas sp. NIBR10]